MSTNASIAEWLKLLPLKEKILSSILSGGTKFIGYLIWDRRLTQLLHQRTTIKITIQDIDDNVMEANYKFPYSKQV